MPGREGVVRGERGRGEALPPGSDTGEDDPGDGGEDEENEQDEEKPAGGSHVDRSMGMEASGKGCLRSWW